LQSFSEFWNVSTRPLAVNGYRLSIEETDRRLRFFERSFVPLYETQESHVAWRILPLKHRVQGTQVHDARLVSIMLANRTPRILTFNTKDFERFDEIEWIRPERFLKSLQAAVHLLIRLLLNYPSRDLPRAATYILPKFPRPQSIPTHEKISS
jgi:hypothetical protein